MGFVHEPVLLKEAITALKIKPNGVYIDATAGMGGHSKEIAKHLNENGRLFSFDKDPDAINFASENLKNYNCAKIIKSDFSQVKSIWNNLTEDSPDGILMDLGVSSYQLDTPERGFSYHNDAKLDMRMSQSGMSAYDLVNSASYHDLCRILFEYGEEKNAKRIASAIVRERDIAPIETTLQLSEIIKSNVPHKVRNKDKHPARKTFQALRIAVNDEIGCLEKAMDDFISMLKPTGRLVIITFHSIEDRVVKKKMNFWAKDCICPPDFPVCVCDKVKVADVVYRKPIFPSEKEMEKNKRSRSAKLRACEKV